MKVLQEQWKDKATLQQTLIILLGVLFGVNGYIGPVFGTWYGDLLAVAMLLIALIYMRTRDQEHQRILEQLYKQPQEIEIVNMEKVIPAIENIKGMLEPILHVVMGFRSKIDPEDEKPTDPGTGDLEDFRESEKETGAPANIASDTTPW